MQVETLKLFTPIILANVANWPKKYYSWSKIERKNLGLGQTSAEIPVDKSSHSNMTRLQ